MKAIKILIYINLFFLQSYLIRFSISSYPTNLQEILILGTAILFTLYTAKTGKIKDKLKSLKNYKILGFFFLTAIIFSITPQITNQLDLIRHLKFIFFALILSYISLETFKAPDSRSKLIAIAGYGAITFGIFSAIYNLIGFNVAADLRLLGPLDAAVYLGYYLTPFFIFFSIESLKSSIKKNIIPAIVLLLLIIFTRSMGSLAGSFAVIFIYILKHNSLSILKKPATKIILATFAIIITLAIIYTKILPTLKYENSSLDERGEIWLTSTHLLQNPSHLIFGLGLGQFQEYYAKTADTALGHPPLDYIVLQPHNIFLLFIFNYGLLGLAALSAFIWQILKSLKNSTTPNISTYLILYFLIHGLIDTPFFKNDMLILIMLLSEFAINKSAHQSRPLTKSIKTA